MNLTGIVNIICITHTFHVTVTMAKPDDYAWIVLGMTKGLQDFKVSFHGNN